MSSSKKHPASQQKLMKARKEGKVSKSQTLSQCFQILGVLLGVSGAIYLFWSSPSMLLQYRGSLNMTGDFPVEVVLWCKDWLKLLVATIFISLGSGVFGAVMGEMLQVGLLITFKSVGFDFKRVDLAQGVGRVGKNLKDSWLLGLKFFGSIFLIFIFLSSHFDFFSSYVRSDAPFFADYSLLISPLTYFSIYMVLLFGGLALIERIVRKHQFLKEQRMSDTELRQEHKDSEGDPLIRSQRKMLQEELSSGALMKRVRKARVVIVKRATHTSSKGGS